MQMCRLIVIAIPLMAVVCGAQTPAAQASATIVQPSAALRSAADDRAWARVGEMQHDAEIAVWTMERKSYRCHFDSATENALICVKQGWFHRDKSFTLSRDEIQSIRMRHDARNRNLCIGIGAAVGAGATAYGLIRLDKVPVVGVSLSPFGDFLFAAVGAFGGGLTGLEVSPLTLLARGTLIYRRPVNEAAGK